MDTLQSVPDCSKRFSLRRKLPEELIPCGNSKVREIQKAPWRIFYRTEKTEKHTFAENRIKQLLGPPPLNLKLIQDQACFRRSARTVCSDFSPRIFTGIMH